MNRILSLIGLAAATWGLGSCVLERRPRDGSPLVDLVRDRFRATPGSTVWFGILAGMAGIALPLGLAMWRGWARCEPTGRITAAFPLLALPTIGIKLVWAALEELMFRGGLVPQIARRAGPWAALALGGVLFALAHLERTGTRTPDPMTLLVMALDGVAFGLAYLATRSLWMPSIWHATKNASIWLLYSESSLQLTPGLSTVTFSGPRLWVGSASQAGIFDLIVTLSLIGAVFVVFRRRLLGDLEWLRRRPDR